VSAVRTLLTVVVAAAILGMSLPAMADARADRTEAELDTAAARVTDAVAALVAREDPVPATERGASRTVTVTIPHAGMADAEVAYFSLGGVPNASAPSIIGYRVAGRPPRQIESRHRFLTGPQPLVLPPGRHHLRLTLVQQSGGARIRVDLPRSSTARTTPDESVDRSTSRPP
jgi:hypothetical protein